MSSYSKCVTSLGLNGKIHGRELKDAAAEYQKDGMAPDKAMLRAVEDKIELMQMEERKIIAAVRSAYEAQGGKKQATKLKKPALTVVPKAEPVVMDEETYLAQNGVARGDMGEAGLHMSAANISKKVWSKKVEAQAKRNAELVARRDELRSEYREKVASGEIRDLTAAERTERTAQGHPDNEATQAAKRLLEKRAARNAAADGSKYSVSGDEQQPSAKEFREAMQEKYPGVRLDLFDRGNGDLNLSLVIVPKEARSTGTGTALMKDMIDFADATGKRIVLTPSDDFGGNKARLRTFYKRFGFVENKGRSKDFTIMDAMYREPKSGDKFSVTDNSTGSMSEDSLRAAVTAGPLGKAVAELIDSGAVVLHKDASTLPGRAVAGAQAVTDANGTIHLAASNLTPENARAVLLHEAFHSGAEKLIGSDNWVAMNKRAAALYKQARQSSGKARTFFDKAAARVATAKAKGAVADAMETEEFMAYAIEEHESAPAGIKKWVDDFIGMVKAWAVKRFGKQLGDLTPAQLSSMAKMSLSDSIGKSSGELAGAYSVDDDRTIEVDGVRRPITNSKGQIIAGDFKKQQAFWQFFGDSKVVDSDGKPMVTYHGTISDFDKASGVFWASQDPAFASTFAEGIDGLGNANVMPVYLKIENPIDMRGIGTRDWLTKDQLARHLGVDTAAIDAGLAPYKWNQGVMQAYQLFNDRKFLRGFKNMGYDGVQWDEVLKDRGVQVGSSPTFATFGSTQVKSATGNNGNFNGSKADIRYSVAADSNTAAEETGLTPPPQGLLRNLQAQIQDNKNRVKQVQDRIGELTGNPDLGKSDYYGAETNRPGRIAARLEDARDHLIQPLMDRLAKSGHTPEDLSELMHAMHAEERNKAVAEINDEMPDGGSGMTTADAGDILKKYESAGELHAIADQARAIARETLGLKLAYGLITKEDHDTLAKMYQYYVPLKGDGEYGPKIKRAMGHDERDELILNNIARDYDQAVVVGEKNLARQSLLRMVLQHPDPDLWTVGAPPKGRYVAGRVFNVVHHGETVGSFTSRSQVDAFMEAKGDKASQYKVLDSNGDRVAEFTKQLQDNEVMVYVKGDPIRIQIHGDEKLASQLRPLNGDQMTPILSAMRNLNQYLSKVYTGYNPSFILRNTARDAMTGSINMVGNSGAVTAAKAWSNYPAATKAMFQWAKNKTAPEGKMGELLSEYRMHGGKVGASWMSDLETHGKSLEEYFDNARGVAATAMTGQKMRTAKVAWHKTVGRLAHVVEILNQTTENSLRLAYFATLRDQGETPAKAAQAAKTVTVDFDRKGTSTGALGAIYLFLNPNIQGTANMLKTITNGKHKQQAWAAVGGLAMLGYYLAAAGLDDDKDRWLGEGWDTRTKNLKFKVGSRKLSIPLSQEYTPAYAFGVALAEASRGESKMQSSARVVSSFIDAYFPLQGAYKEDSDNHALDVGMALIPTALKPYMESAVNRSSFGSQIVPESPNTKDRPDNLKMFRSTKNTGFDKAAQGIAAAGEAMGEGKYENDITKVSPETLKHFWRTYTGGLGQFIADSAGTAGMALDDISQVEATDVPIVKDFVKADNVKQIRSRYMDLTRGARTAITEFEMAKKAGDVDEMDRIDESDKGPLSTTGKMIHKTTKAAAAIRDEAVEVNADTTLKPAEKRAKLKSLEAEEEELYRDGIEAFK